MVDFSPSGCEGIPSHEMGRWWVRRYLIEGVYEWIRTQYHVESSSALPVELLPELPLQDLHLLRQKNQLQKRNQLLRSQLLNQPQSTSQVLVLLITGTISPQPQSVPDLNR
jgi:hypothetical protein